MVQSAIKTFANEGLFYFCLQDREEILKQRREHLVKACLLEGKVPVHPHDIRYENLPESKALIEMTYGIIYCPIPKVGSTFLSRILVATSSNGTINSPFALSRRRSETIQSVGKLKSLFKEEKINKAFENPVSFMAVRDPYTKLFSGYADKLFHPNYLFWRITGRQIQWIIREDTARGNEIMCGHDITFSEFVKYIVHEHEHGNRVNVHFVRLHERCDPCTIKLDYILKIETFKDDTLFLLNVFNESYRTNIKFSNFEQETAFDNARQHVKISFLTLKKYSETCNIPVLSFLFRTWRFLQMSGVIPKTAIFPVKTESSARNITEQDFQDIVSTVISQTDNWTEVRLQRKEALLQAYRSVDREDLEKLSEMLEPDCRYFDYDCSLETLLSDKDDVMLDFDYFDSF